MEHASAAAAKTRRRGAHASQQAPPVRIPASAVRSPVAITAARTRPTAPHLGTPRSRVRPQIAKPAELRNEATNKGFPSVAALRILPAAALPPRSLGRSNPHNPTSAAMLSTSEDAATTTMSCRWPTPNRRRATATPKAEAISATGRHPTAHPRVASVAVSRAANHPARQINKTVLDKRSRTGPGADSGAGPVGSNVSRRNQQAEAPEKSSTEVFAATKGDASIGQTASTTAGMETRRIARRIRSAWTIEGIYPEFGPEVKPEETRGSSSA